MGNRSKQRWRRTRGSNDGRAYEMIRSSALDGLRRLLIEARSKIASDKADTPAALAALRLAEKALEDMR